MELITSLWDSGILGGIATMIVTIVGQLSALNTQKFTAVLETLQKQQSADVAAHDAAFTRSGDGGVFVRRTMLFMAFAILGLCPFIFAFFEDIPVAVETLEQSGGWLWGVDSRKGKLCGGVCERILPRRRLEGAYGKPHIGVHWSGYHSKGF